MPLLSFERRPIHLMIRHALAPSGLSLDRKWTRRWGKVIAGLPGGSAQAKAGRMPQSAGWGRTPETLAWQSWLDVQTNPTETTPRLRMSLAHFTLTHQDAFLAVAPLNNISEVDADALWLTAAPALEALGWRFAPLSQSQASSPTERWVDPTNGPALVWPDRDWALGRSLRTIAPQGSELAAKAWRQALNTVQMIWHSHDVNHAREARNDLPVNGIQVDQPLQPNSALLIQSRHWLIQGTSTHAQLLGGLADELSLGQALHVLEPIWRSTQDPLQGWIREIDDLSAFARSGDISAWLNAWEGLCAPLQRAAQLGRLTLHLLGTEHVVTIHPEETRLGFGWMQRALAALPYRHSPAGTWAEEPSQLVN